jgi:DNA gyrase inhibitor GyrI
MLSFEQKGEKEMIFNVENIPSYTIAYIRKVGPYGVNNIETMERLKNWAREQNLFNDETIIFGIVQDNPEITSPEKCRYDTCVVIPSEYVINDNYISRGNIAGGKYAVLKIEHTAEAVQNSWANIFQELSKQNYQFDETRPIIERYAVRMVNSHYCEICVPVY